MKWVFKLGLTVFIVVADFPAASSGTTVAGAWSRFTLLIIHMARDIADDNAPILDADLSPTSRQKNEDPRIDPFFPPRPFFFSGGVPLSSTRSAKVAKKLFADWTTSRRSFLARPISIPSTAFKSSTSIGSSTTSSTVISDGYSTRASSKPNPRIFIPSQNALLHLSTLHFPSQLNNLNVWGLSSLPRHCSLCETTDAHSQTSEETRGSSPPTAYLPSNIPFQPKKSQRETSREYNHKNTST